MKLWWTLIWTLCIGLWSAVCTGHALKVESRLTHNLDLSWLKVSKFRHSADCYPMGKGDHTDGPWPEKLEFSHHQQSQAQSFLYPVNSKSVPIQLGQIQIGLHQTPGDSSSNTFQFNFTDALTYSGSANLGDVACILREYHWNISSHKISGEILVHYTMPADSWLVAFEIKEPWGQAAAFPTTIRGGLHETWILSDTKIYVWAKPGQTITIPLTINIHSSGGQQGRFQISVTQFAETAAPLSQLADIKDNLARSKNALAFQETFLKVGAGIIGKPNVTRELIGGLGIERFMETSSWLYQIANSDSMDTIYDREVKALAAALGYQMGLALLEEMRPFCGETEVKLDFSDKTLRMPGFLAAYSWIQRDLKKLDSLGLPELRALLIELVQWEKGGLSYAEVAAKPEEFAKLRQAYIEIRRNSDLAMEVFGNLRIGLKKTIDHFGTIAADPMTMSQIDSQLKELSQMQEDLNMAFQEEVMSYKLKNSNKISASQVLTSLNTFEAKVADLAAHLRSSLKFVSFTKSKDDFLALVTNALAHQINLFDHPLKTEYVEAVRKALYDKGQVEGIKQTYGQCLEGVVL